MPAGTRAADGLLLPIGARQELEACARDAVGFATTDVHSRAELPTGVDILEGVADGGLEVRKGWAGARRSVNLPRPGPDDTIVEDNRGFGTRVSTRRISWTLRVMSENCICA